jgi:hypothetical protein
MKVECRNCKFYYNANQECRRYPPVTNDRWIETYREAWCGEFKKNTKKPLDD